MQIDETRLDAHGNSFWADGCPCCGGKEELDTASLCDGCMMAAIVGEYPHGCYRAEEVA